MIVEQVGNELVAWPVSFGESGFVVGGVGGAVDEARKPERLRGKLDSEFSRLRAKIHARVACC
jgi:hypothetical protein